MMTTLRRSAPYLAGGGLISLLLALAARVLGSQPEWLPQVMLALGIVLVISYVMLRPQDVATALTGRQARYGGNALLLSVAFLGILVTLNFLSDRHHKRFDLTENKQYTLSQQTIQILRTLSAPVKVTAFFTGGDSRMTTVDDLLKEYAYQSNQFQYQFVDPEQRPSEARRLGITSYGVLVLESGEKRQETFAVDEQDLTSALLKITRPQQKVVYFTTGHRERDPIGSQSADYGTIGQTIQRDNYQMELLNLATITNTMPVTTAVIVVAAPLVPFAAEEMARLDQWMQDGGRLLLLADPPATTDGQDPLAPFAGLLSKWGIKLRNDVVIDPNSSFFGDARVPLVSRFSFSTITKDLGGLTTFFPVARSLDLTAPAPEGFTITRLVETADTSWGETDLTIQPARFDEGADTRGPLILAVAAQQGEKGARLIVYGDSDFVSNDILSSVQGAFGNGDLFRNSINWLAEEESLIAIGPRPPDVRTMQPLTPAQRNLIFYGAGLFLPLIVLILGGFVWWERR